MILAWEGFCDFGTRFGNFFFFFGWGKIVLTEKVEEGIARREKSIFGDKSSNNNTERGIQRLGSEA